jgi:hypothetical protein|nr:MAG TPA: baseplate protein [Caudoviricetes sp.]DAO80770.1 MAG TPA: baseplate protein [Caudoviricetes sp.]
MLQEFTQEIENTARAVVDSIHTAIPAKIIEFNQYKCNAKVKPYGKFRLSNGVSVSFPEVSEVPVLFPLSTSSGIGISFPVLSGDDCLLIVSEIELDAWRNKAESESYLKFDLTSAVAILGLARIATQTSIIANSQKAVVISAGNNQVIVSQSSITINGNVTINGSISANNLH